MTATDSSPPERTVRWTEHGPEPVASEATVAAVRWDDMSERVGPDDVSHDAAVAPMPVAGHEADTASEAHASADPAAVVARLREKGLLRSEPSIRIREVAPEEPRVVFEPEPIITTGNKVLDDELGDPEALEPEIPGSPNTELRCGGCRTKQRVSDTATGFKCTSCAKVWRWAECKDCRGLNLTIARQESWRCTGCGGYTRSWWRTPTKAAEHRRIAEARATDAADRRRRAAYEKARRRRWKLFTVGAVAIIATAVAAVTFSRNAAPVVTRGANGRVCEAYADVQRSINSQAPKAEIRASIDAMAAESVDAMDRIRLPAQQLAGSGQPGDEAFDKAAKALSNACTT